MQEIGQYKRRKANSNIIIDNETAEYLKQDETGIKINKSNTEIKILEIEMTKPLKKSLF
jgi:hypothetical protein